MPVGVHDATLAEVEARFTSRGNIDRRTDLFNRFRSYLSELRLTDVPVVVYIDGSFTTSKPAPTDIDLVIELPAGYDLASDFPFFHQQVFRADRVRRVWRFDVLVAPAGSEDLAGHIETFQTDSRSGIAKGIIRLQQ
ncbi:MAG: hypothetical protein HY816_20200 [Candidatus Wallbacteria bacterium]|nr:hypothetical protein [Candidatus Wallbacteria bacterium]